jgi:hypothetical protein
MRIAAAVRVSDAAACSGEAVLPGKFGLRLHACRLPPCSDGPDMLRKALTCMQWSATIMVYL